MVFHWEAATTNEHDDAGPDKAIAMICDAPPSYGYAQALFCVFP